MLASINLSGSRLAYRMVLSFLTVGLLICELPALCHSAALDAEEQKEVTKNSLRGRIFAAAKLAMSESDSLPGGQVTGVIAIDPNTGAWELIVETSWPQQASSVRVSPDGKTLVCSVTAIPIEGVTAIVGVDGSVTNTQPEEIWVCDIQGHNKRKVATGKGAGPVWSPDGKYIISSKDRGNGEHDTWRLDADGSNPTKIPLWANERVCNWSADGKWLLTVSDQTFYMTSLDGTERSFVAHRKDGLVMSKPRFAPDSRQIVYVHYPGGGRPFSLRVVDVNRDNDHEVLREENLAAPQEACWSPNGQHLAVVMFDFEILPDGQKAQRVWEGNKRIVIMDADGQNHRLLRLHNVSKVIDLGSLDWR